MPRNLPIVVATTDIPESTQLNADMVAVDFYSADQAPPFAFRSVELVVGKFTIIPIHLGQAITDNVLSPTTTASPRNVPVVVAARDLAQSSQLTRDMLHVAVYSADQTPPFAFRTIDAVLGKFTVIPIHANQALTDNVLSKTAVACPSPHA